jgi:hypothetical protein
MQRICVRRIGFIAMPTYTLRLRSTGGASADHLGVSLADNASAYDYTCSVARELMRNRELETRFWVLDVLQDSGAPVFNVLFARVDPTLNHLRRELRISVERVNEAKRALNDVAHAAELTARESRALVARSQGKPHLVADNGELIIRGFDQQLTGAATQ